MTKKVFFGVQGFITVPWQNYVEFYGIDETGKLAVFGFEVKPGFSVQDQLTGILGDVHTDSVVEFLALSVDGLPDASRAEDTSRIRLDAGSFIEHFLKPIDSTSLVIYWRVGAGCTLRDERVVQLFCSTVLI